MKRHLRLPILLGLALALVACAPQKPEATENSDRTESSTGLGQGATDGINASTTAGSGSLVPEAGTDAEKRRAEKAAAAAAKAKQAAERKPTKEDLADIQLADKQRKERAGKMFGKVIEPLTDASEAYLKHDELEEDTWFGTDKDDNQETINGLLNDAIDALGVSEIATTRQELRTLEERIEELQKNQMSDREARLGAPLEADLNRVQKTITTSQEDYDERIAAADKEMGEAKTRILQLQMNFVRQMRAIGVELDLDGAKGLLSTVTGDDFVQMCVVFDNVRGMTGQLQELTEQSGESLDAAKRYYGSYVVLIRIMDHVQKDFIRRAREEMAPKLGELAMKAQAIALEAEANIANGGDRTIGEQNIRSNELTVRATQLYAEYLLNQADEIEARNDLLQVSLRDAQNTYDTVALSSEVAKLLQDGSRNFAALLKLDLPPLRGFENAELRAEFERLSEQMVQP
ncbi:MAG: hypothetical protein P1V35_10755 [Planctomycetota bacterium]|nr:hypothetical protein [Planctomycetota bacterium]